MAAKKKWYVVTARTGLNLREAPSKQSQVLKVLKTGEKIEADNAMKLPEGFPEEWMPVKGGGFVMKKYIN